MRKKLGSQYGTSEEQMTTLFASKGFSIRSIMLDSYQFGLPQTRKRLYFIAVHPGHLNAFFKQHGKDTNFKKSDAEAVVDEWKQYLCTMQCTCKFSMPLHALLYPDNGHVDVIAWRDQLDREIADVINKKAERAARASAKASKPKARAAPKSKSGQPSAAAKKASRKNSEAKPNAKVAAKARTAAPSSSKRPRINTSLSSPRKPAKKEVDVEVEGLDADPEDANVQGHADQALGRGERWIPPHREIWREYAKVTTWEPPSKAIDAHVPLKYANNPWYKKLPNRMNDIVLFVDYCYDLKGRHIILDLSLWANVASLIVSHSHVHNVFQLMCVC